MDKKIIRTIIITTISVLCAITFAWGAVTIISPYSMGKFSQKLGSEKMASAYFEVDYKRNKSNSRVYNLTASMFYAEKYSKAEKYGKELLKRESFENHYTNGNYINTVVFVSHSKYYTNAQDLIPFLIEHTFHKDGEKIVDFIEYSSILESFIALAYSKGDKNALENLKSTLVVTDKILQDSFLDNNVDASDGVLTDYEQYVIVLYKLETLLSA